MSTRCMIAAETEAGIKGVYVHGDGYPDGRWGKLETLPRMVAEHGLSKVVATLLETATPWMAFDDNPGSLDLWNSRPVPGFGSRFDGEHPWTYFTDADRVQWDLQYVYLIRADGRLEWADKGVTHEAVPWAELEWQDAGVLA